MRVCFSLVIQIIKDGLLGVKWKQQFVFEDVEVS